MNLKKETYKRLGDYIQEVNTRNTDLSVKKLMGINIEKYFMPSVANVIGTDLSNYKVVSKNQFACNLMHVGRDAKIPVALNQGDDIIVSPAYFVFEVKNSKIIPEYLQLVLKRPEFDRNVWFHTDGDVRGGMDKDGLRDLLIPIPDPKEQQSIVDQYNAIQKRIENNKKTIAKLEEAAQAIYRKMFVDDIDTENLPEGWRMGHIGDIADFVRGKNITAAQMIPGNVPVVSAGLNPSGYHNTFNVEGCSVTISSSGVNAGYTRINYENIWAADCSYYNGQFVNFVYAMLMQHKDQVLNLQRGAAQPHVSPGEVHEIETIVPSIDSISNYCETVNSFHKFISLLQKEIKILENINYVTLQ